MKQKNPVFYYNAGDSEYPVIRQNLNITFKNRIYGKLGQNIFIAR